MFFRKKFAEFESRFNAMESELQLKVSKETHQMEIENIDCEVSNRIKEIEESIDVQALENRIEDCENECEHKLDKMDSRIDDLESEIDEKVETEVERALVSAELEDRLNDMMNTIMEQQKEIKKLKIKLGIVEEKAEAV